MQVLHDKKSLNLSFSCVLFSDEIKEQNQIFKVNHDSTFQNSMADNSGMLVVIRRSDETVIETVSNWIWQEWIRSKTERVNAPGFLVRGASLCFHPLG